MRPGVSPLMADVLDLSDGRYSVSYNATISGLWQVGATRGTAPCLSLASTPFIAPLS